MSDGMTPDEIKAVINRHCQSALETPFAYGRSDCCTFACDVVREVTGVDPMADLRGRYATRPQAVATQFDATDGGLVDTVQMLARQSGFAQTFFPWSGHLVGIVATPVGPVMGLFDGTAWIVRSERGIARMAAHLGVLGWSFAP